MKYLQHLILAAFSVLCASCTSMTKTNVDGSVTTVKALGGKGALKDEPEGLSFVYNNEKSFYHGTVLAGVVASGYFSAATAKATEETARFTEAQATKRFTESQVTSRNATNVGAEVVKGANANAAALEIAPQYITPKGY